MKMSVGLGSHLPVLIRALDNSKGPVLEIGMGFYSTPFLHWYCLVNNRKLVSWESDGKWAKKHFWRYKTSWHEIKIADDWDEANFDGFWSVILIDHGPNPRRIYEIDRLKNQCDYMVVHDTEEKNASKYNYSKILPKFKYRKDFILKDQPSTSILSNNREVKDLWI